MEHVMESPTLADGPDRAALEGISVAVMADAEAAPGRLSAVAWLAESAHDAAWRDATVDEMGQDGQVYSEEETELIAKGVSLLDSVAAGTGNVRPFKHSNTVTSAWTKHDMKSGLLLGHAEAMIHASPEQIIAYQMHVNSKIKLSQLDPTFEVRYEILERLNLHHIVTFYEVKGAPSLQNRTFLSSIAWRKVSDAPLTFVWVTMPTARHNKVPPKSEALAVRAEALRCLRCTKIADGLTNIHYACSIDFHGRFRGGC
jgi:hypothetical protein